MLRNETGIAGLRFPSKELTVSDGNHAVSMSANCCTLSMSTYYQRMIVSNACLMVTLMVTLTVHDSGKITDWDTDKAVDKIIVRE